ncbi:PulJ/GspJ family protein [Aciditerrimonas ferrireducens]|jgi:type II secretory pathway pseudopilin PulG|uniref:PulJ/GspJ family protein n=1 Tax=Aciditerrimonas ferrireducens TaxID=667306 RepID=UPI00249DC409|nr:prepilin-type N-terminal cleavage/methylation domain-containing protein [Aciditerrimonas ferrireducens]
MSGRSQLVTDPLGRSVEGGQGGWSLVELLVALAVFMVVLAMTATIVTVVSQQSSADLTAARTSETSTVALSGLTAVLEGAVTPEAAWVAEGNPTGQDPPADAGICWDDPQNPSRTLPSSAGVQLPDPGPQPPSPLLGPDPMGTVPAPSPYQGDLVDPNGLAVIYAHDTAVELCTYPPNQTTPVVEELWLDPASCTSRAASDATYDPSVVGDCTLDVVRFDPYVGPTASSTNDYAPADPLEAPNATVVDQVTHVWCDQACQAGTSCWSYLDPSTGQPVDAPPVCPDLSPATEARFTPPLFTYLGAGGASVAANDAQTPLDLFCGPISGAPPACQPTVTPTSSTDDTVNLVAAGIQAVEVRLTFLGDAASGSQLTTDVAGRPAVALQRTVALANLAQGGGS